LLHQKNVLWSDLSPMQKNKNLFLTKILWALTLEYQDIGHPTGFLFIGKFQYQEIKGITDLETHLISVKNKELGFRQFEVLTTFF